MVSMATPLSKNHFGTLRPVSGASFALIDQIPVIFSEDAQKLFQLNNTSAFIWCNLQDAVPLKSVGEQLVERGLSPNAARASLQHALSQWLAAGLVVPHIEAPDFAFTAMIGHKPIEVHTSDAEALSRLQSLFITTSPHDGRVKPRFTVHRVGDVAIVLRDGRKILECTINALAPTFRAYAIDHLLLADDGRDVIFHAAAVISEERGILISAPPGMGKSTLTMHLLDAGFAFGSDDIVRIAPGGDIRGAPFAPTLKSGAWPLVRHFRPDVPSAMVHDRVDGNAVRYLDVGPSFHDRAIRASWIIFLERAPRHTRPTLMALTELDTLKRIVDASFASHGKLTADGFHTLKTIVSRARAFVLQYEEAVEAARKLIELCGGKT
jgi:hypothetical protein